MSDGWPFACRGVVVKEGDHLHLCQSDWILSGFLGQAQAPQVLGGSQRAPGPLNRLLVSTPLLIQILDKP